MRALLLVSTVLTLLGLVAPSVEGADAALTQSGTELTFTSDAQDAENLFISVSSEDFDCSPTAAPGTPTCLQIANGPQLVRDMAADCVKVTDEVAACFPFNGFTKLTLNLNDGEDFAVMNASAPPVTFEGGSEDDTLESRNGSDTIHGGEGNDDIDDSGGNDVLDGGPGDDDFFLGSGNDDVIGGNGADTAFLASGDDTVRLDDIANDGTSSELKNIHTDIEVIDGGGGSDNLFGSPLANFFVGGSGNDLIDGGGGPDVLEGETGADELIGGADIDRVVYSDSAAQTITLDDVRNDGGSGELDNVRSDIEDVSAGDGNDDVTGSELPNVLDGGAGADRLVGGGGVDTFLGGAGADLLFARDGLQESVDCGTETDTGEGDTIDLLTDCEGLVLSSELIPDADGDGVNKPDDCNDANPAIRPGVLDIPENGIDEDCSGADAAVLDRDGDGFLIGQDCNDANPAVHPGAVDVPRNGVDEDCTGGDRPFPVLRASISFAFSVFTTHTELDRYRAAQLTGRERIRLRCKGPGCPFKVKRLRARKAGSRNLIKLVGDARFRPGAVLKAFITAPNVVGRYHKITFRDKKAPTVRKRCVQPGASKPSNCPRGA